MLSDTHFGHPGALLRSTHFLELIDFDDEVVIAGDLLELTHCTIEQALKDAHPFFERIADKKVFCVPGNHDVQLLNLDNDLRQLAGEAHQYGPRRLRYVEQLLAPYLPNIEVHHPFLVREGVTVMHGHQIEPHLGAIGYAIGRPLLTRISSTPSDPFYFTAADYDKFAVAASNLVRGVLDAQVPPSQAQTKVFAPLQEQQTKENLILRALRMWRKMRSKGSQNLGDLSSDAFVVYSPEEAVRALSIAAQRLQVPDGPVLFGHTHAPFKSIDSGRWQFTNTGSWYLNPQECTEGYYKRLLWPGQIVSVDDGKISYQHLLDDWSAEEMRAALTFA